MLHETPSEIQLHGPRLPESLRPVPMVGADNSQIPSIAKGSGARWCNFALSSRRAEYVVVSVVVGVALVAAALAAVFIFAASFYSRVEPDPRFRRLQKYDMPSIDGMVNHDDMDALLARFKRPDGQYVESIAIVGSSGNLLYRGKGRVRI